MNFTTKRWSAENLPADIRTECWVLYLRLPPGRCLMQGALLLQQKVAAPRLLALGLQAAQEGLAPPPDAWLAYWPARLAAGAPVVSDLDGAVARLEVAPDDTFGGPCTARLALRRGIGGAGDQEGLGEAVGDRHVGAVGTVGCGQGRQEERGEPGQHGEEEGTGLVRPGLSHAGDP